VDDEILKVLGMFLLLLVAALVVDPAPRAGRLFIWLKLTEEGDEESLELDGDNL
jgi:hypothetical protein